MDKLDTLIKSIINRLQKGNNLKLIKKYFDNQINKRLASDIIIIIFSPENLKSIRNILKKVRN